MTQQEYTALVDRCKQLSYEYYMLAQPTVSDAQFDALVSEIEQAESEHPEWTLADSPTQMVGSDVDPKSGRRLIRHRTRMLSCQKAQTQEAVTKWMQTTEKKLKKTDGLHYVLEWKLDGISCSLVYQDGVLVSAATRGEKGIMGQDLLAHVKRMPTVPQHIYMDGRVEVRGEIVCPKANLAALGYKDCRTAAAALCNQATPSRDMARLEFVAWQLDTTDGIGTESVGIDLAADQGFKTSGYRGCWSGDVLTRLDEFAVRREALEWPTDGVVIKIDCRPLAVSLGCTEHHPKGSIAYKFSAQKTVTRVISIEISIGEKGGRTPVAHLEPVMIMGREVSAASLYSERVWHELGVTEGCLVEVGLTNDVTPKIYRVVEPAPSEVADAPTLEGHTDITDGTDIVAGDGESSSFVPTTDGANLTDGTAGDTAGTGSADTESVATDQVPVPSVSLAPESEEASGAEEPTVIESEQNDAPRYSEPAESQNPTPTPTLRGAGNKKGSNPSLAGSDDDHSERNMKIFAAVATAVVFVVLVNTVGLFGIAALGLLAGGIVK